MKTTKIAYLLPPSTSRSNKTIASNVSHLDEWHQANKGCICCEILYKNDNNVLFGVTCYKEDFDISLIMLRLAIVLRE